MLPSLTSLLESAVEAARQAGALIRERAGGDLGISFKDEGKNNLVTVMDTASEDLIRRLLGERHPDVLFLAEESGGNQDLTQLTWVVDPIDGTVNYAHGIPMYCVSIAAVMENQPVVGVVFNPNTDELFTATRGGGAYLNGKRIAVSTNAELDRSLLVTGFPYDIEANPYGCVDALLAVLRRAIPVRRLGSAALDLAYVAAGRFDAYWEVSLHEWDVAAGQLLVTEAGGKIGTYAKEEPARPIYVDRIIASNGLVHDELLALLLDPPSRG